MSRITDRLHDAWLVAPVLGLALFAGCGKVQEAATEKVTEKMIESAITKEGGSAKVDLGGNGAVKAEGVDKDGKAYKVEMGQAQVTEKDLGLPFYPGAQSKSANRIVNDGSEMVQVELLTSDPLPRVVEFYRAQLKPLAGAGSQSMEQVQEASAMLMLGQGDDASLMVNLDKSDDPSGTRITLTHGRKVKGG